MSTFITTTAAPRRGAGLAACVVVALVAISTAVARAPEAAKQPERATPGHYVGELAGRELNLKVSRDGRYMTGWIGWLQLTCGGYPGLPTYPVTALDFPKTKIAKGGRLSREWDGDGFTMNMQARFVRKKVRNGKVSYSGPGRCRGSGEWTARLKR